MHSGHGAFSGLDRVFPVFLQKGIVVVGLFDTARNERRLHQCQFSGFLVEKVACRHPQAMAVAAHVELVAVKFENFFLGKIILQPEGLHQFLDLGLETAGFALEQVLGGLLCQGAATLHHSIWILFITCDAIFFMLFF